MSTLNRNTLALALAAALLPAGAFAFDAQTAGDIVPETIALQSGTIVQTSEAFTINIAAGDNIIGRTQGFNVKLTLLDGAQFHAVPGILGPVTPGSALVPGSNAAWNATVFGGGIGATVLQIQLSNQSDGAFVGPGQLLGPVTFDLQNVSTAGLTRVLVELIDSGTGQVIANGTGSFSFTSNLIVRSNGLDLACDPLAGDVGKRIDVASDQNTGSKTRFTPGPFAPNPPGNAFGAIGSALGGNGETYFNAGLIDLNAIPGFSFVANDDVDLTVDGTFGTAITGAFLSTSGDCSLPFVIGTINPGGTQVTFQNIDPSVPGAFPEFFCVVVAANNTTPIDQSTFIVSGTFTRNDDASPFTNCGLLPMQFNGSVVKVFTFNPAGNTTQESFLRVTNWGNTGGKVTVEGWDDTGAPAPSGNVTFNLNAGESLQFNSADLENGNASKFTGGAFGDGTGKWRLVVTGEFDGMTVSSLNRNNVTGTLTNITDADNFGEQQVDQK